MKRAAGLLHFPPHEGYAALDKWKVMKSLISTEWDQWSIDLRQVCGRSALYAACPAQTS